MDEMLNMAMEASPDRTPMPSRRQIAQENRNMIRFEDETPRVASQPPVDMELEIDVPTRPVTPTMARPYDLMDVPSTSQSTFNPAGLSRDLQERFPILLVHSPIHEHLWSRLTAGTRFVVAALALKYNINLDEMEPSELLKLEGPNHSMMQVLEVLLPHKHRSISLDVDDLELKKVADELDWEAEQIVEGNGEMLGWREDKGTRYGGKIQFSATVKVDEPGTGSARLADLELNNSAKFSLDIPRFRGSCIFTRVFGSHRFLRIRMSSSIQSTVSVWCQTQEQREANQTTLREWARRPIVILGQVYSFLVEKDGTLIYFLEGPDNVGRMFEKGKLDYGIKECRTVPELIDWWIPFEFNQEQTMSKLTTRLELGVSDTLPGVLVRPENVRVRPDISRRSF
jgi:hypothetical protein